MFTNALTGWSFVDDDVVTDGRRLLVNCGIDAIAAPMSGVG